MRIVIPAFGMVFLALVSVPARAAHSVNEQRAVDPHGAVQISAVAGTVEVLGVGGAMATVTGTLPNDSDSVEISGDAAHLTIAIRSQPSARVLPIGNDSPRITIQVPAGSSVTSTLVSADFRTSGLTGDLELRTVSGDAKGEVGGNLRVSGVSGDVRLAAPAAHTLAVKTVSGDMELTGGDGETDISTVSGTAHVTLGTQSHMHFKTTSGDMHIRLGLTPSAQVEGEAVSGDVGLTFRETPAADFDVQTHSGDIDNCFGPKPTEPPHGPGQRLVFKNGDANARVRVVTHSGDVDLCTDNNSPR